MSKKYKNSYKSSAVKKEPKRGEIWIVVDKNEKHNKKEGFDDSIQGGTRFCIVVSNNKGNHHSPVVEIVYTTTQSKNDLPTHFFTMSTPKPSTVLCEQIMTVAKKDLTRHYGTLDKSEISELNKCLKISLGL